MHAVPATALAVLVPGATSLTTGSTRLDRLISFAVGNPAWLLFPVQLTCPSPAPGLTVCSPGGAGRRQAGILHDGLSRKNHPLCHYTHLCTGQVRAPQHFVCFPFPQRDRVSLVRSFVGPSPGEPKTRRAKGRSPSEAEDLSPDHNTRAGRLTPRPWRRWRLVGVPGHRLFRDELAPVTSADLLPLWVFPARRTGTIPNSV